MRKEPLFLSQLEQKTFNDLLYKVILSQLNLGGLTVIDIDNLNQKKIIGFL